MLKVGLTLKVVVRVGLIYFRHVPQAHNSYQLLIMYSAKRKPEMLLK
jgi:hypothetical protein